MYEKSNLRIRKYGAGWVSEIRKPRWTLFGTRWKWTHFISVSGISEKPWFFKTREFAEEETLKLIKKQIFEQDYNNDCDHKWNVPLMYNKKNDFNPTECIKCGKPIANINDYLIK